MKIMQIIPTLETAGAEMMCTLLSKELAHDNEVVVISLYDKRTHLSDSLKLAGIRLIFLDKKLGLDLSMIAKLKRIVKAEKPDVIHTHLDCLKYAYLAGRMCGVKRYVHTVHNLAEKEAAGMAATVNRFYFRHCGVTAVALSNEIKTSITNMYGLAESKVPIVYNGIDIEKCEGTASYEDKAGIQFIHVGRFSKQKNHSFLVDIFKEHLKHHPASKLLLAGEGELLEATRKKVEELGISENVIFLGLTSNIFSYLIKSDVFILPSLYEGMPMSIIEAMVSGLPIIATNVGGVPDMLENNKEALLTSFDQTEILGAMDKMYDSTFRKQLGENAGRKARELFTSKNMANSYMKLYLEKN